MHVEYRPTQDHDWMLFSDGQFSEASIRLANAVVGFEKYRLVETKPKSSFGEVE